MNKEEPKIVSIKLSEMDSLTVNTPPVVKIENVVNYCGYAVSGTFDFSGIPKQYHGLFLRILLTRLGKEYEYTVKKENKPLKKINFWTKWKNKFK
jgi:hypothetical protein